MTAVEALHRCYVHDRRARILSRHLVELIPKNSSLLDVGCGDGLLAQLISQKRPDVALRGIDVSVRDRTYIMIDRFDGQTIPYGDASFDAVMFVDVLHHTKDPTILLREAARVARRMILIKDHTLDGLFAAQTLRFTNKLGLYPWPASWLFDRSLHFIAQLYLPGTHTSRGG